MAIVRATFHKCGRFLTLNKLLWNLVEPVKLAIKEPQGSIVAVSLRLLQVPTD
jgi:hypothetical protein